MSKDIAEKAKAYFDEWAFGKNISGCHCSDAVEYAITRDREERDPLAAKLERLVKYATEKGWVGGGVYFTLESDGMYTVCDLDAQENMSVLFDATMDSVEEAIDTALKGVGEGRAYDNARLQEHIDGLESKDPLAAKLERLASRVVKVQWVWCDVTKSLCAIREDGCPTPEEAVDKALKEVTD